MIYILCLLLFSTTSIPEKTPPTWPSLTTPLPTPLASPLPYSRMIFEGICGTISELGLIKLSSEFSTLASPHATQLTSSEEYLKGVAQVRPYSEYLSLILFTNSQPNFPTRLFTLDTNRQTHTLSNPDLQRTSGLETFLC